MAANDGNVPHLRAIIDITYSMHVQDDVLYNARRCTATT